MVDCIGAAHRPKQEPGHQPGTAVSEGTAQAQHKPHSSHAHAFPVRLRPPSLGPPTQTHRSPHARVVARRACLLCTGMSHVACCGLHHVAIMYGDSRCHSIRGRSGWATWKVSTSLQAWACWQHWLRRSVSRPTSQSFERHSSELCRSTSSRVECLTGSVPSASL